MALTATRDRQGGEHQQGVEFAQIAAAALHEIHGGDDDQGDADDGGGFEEEGVGIDGHRRGHDLADARHRQGCHGDQRQTQADQGDDRCRATVVFPPPRQIHQHDDKAGDQEDQFR